MTKPCLGPMTTREVCQKFGIPEHIVPPCPECGQPLTWEQEAAMRRRWLDVGGPNWRRDRDARRAGLLAGIAVGWLLGIVTILIMVTWGTPS